MTKVKTGLPAVPAGLVLIAVVNDDIETVGMARNHQALAAKIIQVPPHLRAITLVGRTGRRGIGACAQVPGVFDRIGVNRSLLPSALTWCVHRPHGSLPGTEHGTGCDGAAARIASRRCGCSGRW